MVLLVVRPLFFLLFPKSFKLFHVLLIASTICSGALVVVVVVVVVSVSVVEAVVGCVNSMLNKLVDETDDNNNKDGDDVDESFVKTTECALSDTCSCLKDSRCVVFVNLFIAIAAAVTAVISFNSIISPFLFVVLLLFVLKISFSFA